MMSNRTAYSREQIDNLPAIVTVKQAAAAIGVADRRAYTMIREGNFPLPVRTVGKRMRVSVEDIRRFLGMAETEHSAVTPQPASTNGLHSCCSDSFVPAPRGWQVRFTRAGARRTTPLAGWMRRGDQLTPMVHDANEVVPISKLESPSVYFEENNA